MQRVCAILSSVACPAIQYVSTLSHKRYDFREKKKLMDTKCVFWFSLQLWSETFLILRTNERDRIKNVYWSSCEVPFILVRFQWHLNVLDRLSKNHQISWKSVQWEPSSSMRTDGRTWRSLILAFWDFANAPKNFFPKYQVVMTCKLIRCACGATG